MASLRAFNKAVEQGWGNWPTFLASYGLKPTPDGYEEGKQIWKTMLKSERDAVTRNAFYAQASDHHLHRRASLLELHELFQPTPASTRTLTDHPAHWYECQLIHYGLRRSKTKSVARMRLLDAFNAGGMAVPQSLQDLETKLKRQWDKAERQAKKQRREMASTTSVAAPGDSGQQTSKEPGRPLTQGRDVQTANRSKEKRKLNNNLPRITIASKARTTTVPSGTAGSVRSQTDRLPRLRLALPARAFVDRDKALGGPDRSTQEVASAPGRSTATEHLTSNDKRDEDDIVMEDASFYMDDANREVFEYIKQEDDCPSHSQSSNLIDLSNVMYSVRTSIGEEWEEYSGHESTIILCMVGNQLWGLYDFGMFEGAIRMTERRRGGLGDIINFQWRGIENSEKTISYDESRQTGQITIGDGSNVSGTFYEIYGPVSFWGRRVAIRQTDRGHSSSTLERRWNRYREEAYEEEPVRRWG
ncbi:hypothetical protein LTR95_001025 [Oleoguttula sp. CCFEE 5521]